MLDEPDTHLNPTWKWQYLDLLHRVVTDEDATQILITTHDPLVIGSLTREQVRVFRVHSHTGHITAEQPDIDPQGLGVAGILTSELFGLGTTVDQETNRRFIERNELLYRQGHQQLDEAGKERLQELFIELNRKGFINVDKDRFYTRFLQATAQREEFQFKKEYTKEELEAQNRLALSILDELFEEQAK